MLLKQKNILKRKGEELFVKWEDADSFLKSKTGIVE